MCVCAVSAAVSEDEMCFAGYGTSKTNSSVNYEATGSGMLLFQQTAQASRSGFQRGAPTNTNGLQVGRREGKKLFRLNKPVGRQQRFPDCSQTSE